MAVVRELYDSRKLNLDENGNGSLSRFYHVDSGDPTVAITDAALPAYGTAYAVSGVNFYAADRKASRTKNTGISLVEVIYTTSKPRVPEVGDTFLVVEFSSQTAHIEVALSQSHYPDTAETNTGNIIGLQGNGDVQGVDILVPTGRIEYQTAFDNSTLTAAFRRQIFEIVNTINNTDWSPGGGSDWKAGELLFTGAKFTPKNSSQTIAIYSFNVELNRNAGSIGQLSFDPLNGGPTISFDKDGQQYVWYSYGPKIDRNSREVTINPIAAHVADVYEAGDFTQLGI